MTRYMTLKIQSLGTTGLNNKCAICFHAGDLNWDLRKAKTVVLLIRGRTYHIDTVVRSRFNPSNEYKFIHLGLWVSVMAPYCSCSVDSGSNQPILWYDAHFNRFTKYRFLLLGLWVSVMARSPLFILACPIGHALLIWARTHQ